MKGHFVAAAVLVAWAAGLTIGAGVRWISDAEAFPIVVPGQGVAQGAGYPQFGADTTVDVTSTATTAGTAAMDAGFYVAYCTTLTHVDQGTTGVVAVNTERPIPANTLYGFQVTGVSDTYLSWIRNAADGTCYIGKDDYK